MTATVKNHKRIIAVILMIIIAAVFTAVPQETHAASKVKTMTAYNKIYKCGSKVYCNDDYYVTKANLKKPKAKAKKLFDVGGHVDYVTAMKKKGKYLYFLYHEFNWDTEKYNGKLYRVKVTTGKKKCLAEKVKKYAISGKKIYYKQGKKNKVMKLNGKSKHSTKYTVKMTTKKSNAKNYKIIKKGRDDGAVNVYLKTPKGKKIFLDVGIGS